MSAQSYRIALNSYRIGLEQHLTGLKRPKFIRYWVDETRRFSDSFYQAEIRATTRPG